MSDGKYKPEGQSAEDWRDAYGRRLRQQLLRLRGRRADWRPFLMVRDVATGKFVQVVGSKEEPFVLDLPTTQIMSDEELQAAERLLGEARDFPAGKRAARSYRVFNGGPYVNEHAAAEMVLEVMAQVFHATGRHLDVTIHSNSSRNTAL